MQDILFFKSYEMVGGGCKPNNCPLITPMVLTLNGVFYLFATIIALPQVLHSHQYHTISHKKTTTMQEGEFISSIHLLQDERLAIFKGQVIFIMAQLVH